MLAVVHVHSADLIKTLVDGKWRQLRTLPALHHERQHHRYLPAAFPTTTTVLSLSCMSLPPHRCQRHYYIHFAVCHCHHLSATITPLARELPGTHRKLCRHRWLKYGVACVCAVPLLQPCLRVDGDRWRG